MGERGWLGDDTSGGFRAALVMLSRCRKEGLKSSAEESLTGGVACIAFTLHLQMLVISHHSLSRYCALGIT